MSDILTLKPRTRTPYVRPPAPGYVELGAISNFSFLNGGSHPEELVVAAAHLDLRGLGLADINSLAGVVRGYSALKDLADSFPIFRYHVGARLRFADDTPEILAYPTDRAAYGRLCHMLTTGNRRTRKGECDLRRADLDAHLEGLLLIVMPPRGLDAETDARLGETLATLPKGQVWLGADPLYDGADRARIARLAGLAHAAGVPLLATNNVLYHTAARRRLQDVLTCIREHITIDDAGLRLEKNAERHLKTAPEMAYLFSAHPEALAETVRLSDRLGFTLDQLRYNYPEETVGNGETAQQTLVRLAWAGARNRYPGGVPYKIKRGVLKELRLIADKQYAPYFLTVHDLVRFARHERGILCQGRGSAANSVVCYCLEITEVDPMVGNLVFGRFISTERDEPPDIDVDFEHERREEVMQYLYAKYSRARTGLTSTVVTYRSKGAMREVGKAFGLSEDTINAINALSWGWYSKDLKPERMKELGLDANEPRLRLVLELGGELLGFPRHLSQHTGGFVITRDRLDHLIPIANAAMEDRTVVEWNKDDLDTLGILKVDVLALGMLTCVRRGFELMHRHYGTDLTLAEVLQDQQDRVYAMIQRADTLGVFQIESRAQMTMLPRLKPAEFYDLVIEVAIVRPGPIQGGMVHPYLKRRLDREAVQYPSPQLEAVLKRTLGVPLFQEQAMQIAIVGAGFSPGEADRLRRAMATWRRNGKINEFRDRFICGMLANGYDADFAGRCFAQIEGFGEYGFPESHAASFALLVYVSCWLKCYYPDVFAAALLNSQPMGFYAPAQIVRDAREHGVDIRVVDVNLSHLEATLEAGPRAADQIWPRHRDMAGDIRSTHAIRLGFNQVKGLPQAVVGKLLARRGAGYDSVRDVWLRTGMTIAHLETLAEADAFASLGLTRRDALWAVRGLNGAEGAGELPLFAVTARDPARTEPDAALPPMPPGEEVIHDYKSLSLSLKGHPMRFLRPGLDTERTVSCEALAERVPDGRTVSVAGLVLVRQRPGTASGVIFATIEDETGHANIIVWPKIFEANRRTVLGSRVLRVTGKVQREGLVVHLVAARLEDLTDRLGRLSELADIGHATLARADEGRSEQVNPLLRKAEDQAARAARQAHAAMPKGRNFH